VLAFDISTRVPGVSIYISGVSVIIRTTSHVSTLYTNSDTFSISCLSRLCYLERISSNFRSDLDRIFFGERYANTAVG
jgi:hypothetical protein